MSLASGRRRVILRPVLALSLLACLAAAGAAQTASRDWQTGTWGTVAAGRQSSPRAHVIETQDFRFEVQETIARGAAPLSTPEGASVTFAIDKDTIYIREGATDERSLRLVRSTRKLKVYAAVGPGHFIRAVNPDGRTVTLEDGSVWETEPNTQDELSGWQPLHSITVHTNDELEGFNYFLDNTEIDGGVIARLASSSR